MVADGVVLTGKRRQRLPRMDHPEVDQPGISFERAVAAIQEQFEPKAAVTHNEFLVDRLNQRRQFDVVFRACVAGHDVLGVIECKDLKGKVGTPEVDAFVTKAQDVNAQLKILVSRNGFTKPALAKCTHYGVRALSLFEDLPEGQFLFVGARWEADIYAWGEIRTTVQWTAEAPPEGYRLEDVAVEGHRLLDSLTNLLLSKFDELKEEVWVSVDTSFSKRRLLRVAGLDYEASGVHFYAQRVCNRYAMLTRLSGKGVFDWNSNVAVFPPGAQLDLGAVTGDFSAWDIRGPGDDAPAEGLFRFSLEGRSAQFDYVETAPSLDDL